MPPRCSSGYPRNAFLPTAPPAHPEEGKGMPVSHRLRRHKSEALWQLLLESTAAVGNSLSPVAACQLSHVLE